MKNFVALNWFKIILLILFFWFILSLNSGIKIEHSHRGYIESNYSDLDGVFIYSNFDDVNR